MSAEGDRVRITTEAESHLPLEAFASLAERQAGLEVWGTSSSALLGVSAWPDTRPRCVDADYLEPEIRRQALQFSRRHGLPLTTLRFDDPLLDAGDRNHLRRRLRAPAAERARVLACVPPTERAAQAARTRARAEAEHHVLESLLLVQPGRTWIWGAGSGGRLAIQRLRALGVEPAGVIDGAGTQAARDRLEDVRVVAAPAAREARAAGALVLIASTFGDDILARIEADGDWASIVLVWTP